jgi:hypothetical protein
MYNNISDWDRMVAGKLYNSVNKDIFKRHALGLTRCDRFNKIALWRFKTKQRRLKNLFRLQRVKSLQFLHRFTANMVLT